MGEVRGDRGSAGSVDETSRVVRFVLRGGTNSIVFRVVGDAAGGERRREHALGALEVSVQLRTSGRGARGARTDFRFGV